PAKAESPNRLYSANLTIRPLVVLKTGIIVATPQQIAARVAFRCLTSAGATAKCLGVRVNTYNAHVKLFEITIAIETEMVTGDCGAPNDEYYAHVVETLCDMSDVWAMTLE
ncbi:hypothetical protein LTR39_003959, partial [Cryomyces antarcticus]